MENQKKKIAIIRGDSLNEWEGKLWEVVSSEFDLTGFCSKKNSYDTSNLSYPVIRLRSTSDSSITKHIHKYLFGQYKVLHGLEKQLADFDIAHTAEIFNGYTTQAVRAKQLNPKLKVVTYVYDNSFGRFEYNYWPGFTSPPASWRKQIYSIIEHNAKGVDLFEVPSSYSAELLQHYGVDPKKIHIVVPPISLPENKGAGVGFLKELGLADQEIYLVVNRMVKEKGVYDVLYGWEMFIKEINNRKKTLIFIGNGKEKVNLMRIAKEHGLSDSVHFVNHAPNDMVRSLYKEARALILASMPTSLWQEQFGFVLAEAICSGCPVISTYSGAIPEVIENAGLLFSPGNPVELKKKLLELEDPMLCQELKNNCARVQQKFSVEAFKQNIIQRYSHLIT